MKKLIIFGLGDLAEIAYFYFTHDSDFQVVAFTVDLEFLTTNSFQGLPVAPFDHMEQKYPVDNHSLFIAVGYSELNALRREKYLTAKKKGYSMASYLSSKATAWPGFQLRENCFIFEGNTINPFVSIGNNVTLWSGNHVGHHSRIGDHCFISSHVVISGGVDIGEECFIGVNATIRDHVKIGARCIIGAGALILADAEPEGVYIGQATKRTTLKSTRQKKI